MNQELPPRDVSEPDGPTAAARRAYQAPALIVFGNVEDFTRGNGSKTADFPPNGTRRIV